MKPKEKRVWTCTGVGIIEGREPGNNVAIWGVECCDRMEMNHCKRMGCNPQCRPITITITDGHKKEGE